MSNQKFQNALGRKPQSCPPVWMMRQAGRYHKHYQALRAKHSFMELCKNPELACEVTMGPIEDFDFDVAILFSDLLFPLEALGMGLSYGDGGPELGWHLDSQNIKNLGSVDRALKELQFQKEATSIIRKRLPQEKSLIGFVGGPWTLFCYAVQGKHEGGLVRSKASRDLFAPFCEKMIPLLKANIQLQLDGGAEVVMVFDTAAGELAPQEFQNLVVPELEKLPQAHPQKLGYYSKTTRRAHLDSPQLLMAPWAGFGVDQNWNFKNDFPFFKNGFIQGNFDQTILKAADPKDFKKILLEYLKPLAQLSPEERAGWVCGLGHGVLPQTPEANVRTFVQTVREIFK